MRSVPSHTRTVDLRLSFLSSVTNEITVIGQLIHLSPGFAYVWEPADSTAFPSPSLPLSGLSPIYQLASKRKNGVYEDDRRL